MFASAAPVGLRCLAGSCIHIGMRRPDFYAPAIIFCGRSMRWA